MSRYHYEPPANEEDFEELVCDLYNAMNNTNSFQLYRGRGNSQYGVDIFSRELRVVIQCKKKDPLRKDSELRSELASDLSDTVGKALGWPKDFKTLIFATTSKKFSAIQDQAIVLTDENSFEVHFVAWPDIERHIHRHPEVRSRHYPHLQQTAKSAAKSTVLRLPIPNTIGANALMKLTIQEKFNRLGSEREKRFGKTAYPVMYKKFVKDFKIGKHKWTVIWDWPEPAANPICTYLDEKWINTIGGRKETAKSKADYIPSRPQLFAMEKQWLNVLGLDMKGDEVKQLLLECFNISSHTKLSHSQHWLFVFYLEQTVKQRVGE